MADDTNKSANIIGMTICSRCPSEAIRKQGNQWLCPTHYRFGQMRCVAKRDEKSVPSHEQLVNLLSYLDGMKCPHCQRVMNWMQEDGSSTQVTLQHYRSGSMGLICLACNTRHGQMEGDTFNDLPADKKICPGCEVMKPLSDFRNDNLKRWKSKQSYCRECANKRMREWVEKNREKVNARQREGRRRRKVAR